MTLFCSITRLKFAGLMLGSMLLMAACSSNPPATRYYLLSDPQQMAGLSDTGCRAKYSGTALAPYLQRTHIMLRTGTNELVPALHHRWSEPLDAGISRLLSSCLGSEPGAGHSAAVTIEHLHGSTDGQVVLQAQWVVKGVSSSDAQSASSSDAGAVSGRFSRTLAQPEPGYDSLVSTQRALVLGLCEDIRAALPSC